MTRTTPIISIAILSVLYDGLLNIPYKAIRITITELNPKSTDKVTAKVLSFQKNCPIRQINKGTIQQTRKISHPSIVCESIALLDISISNNPIETTKTISCQNFSTDLNVTLFILSILSPSPLRTKFSCSIGFTRLVNYFVNNTFTCRLPLKVFRNVKLLGDNLSPEEKIAAYGTKRKVRAANAKVLFYQLSR